MPHQPTGRESIMLPATSAFAICDGLLRMAHCFLMELPETDLRHIRCTLENLLVRAEQVLDEFEFDLSLNFDALAIEYGHPPPGAEDFGAVLVSTTFTTETSESSHHHRRNTISRVAPPATTLAPTPVPTPAPIPVPAPVLTHGPFPLIISSRPNIRIPDYINHPYFVRSGIPGTYHHPPTESGSVDGCGYYVISKGLYVGIFDDRHEIGPWVLGVPGNVFSRVATWEDARDLYNAHLTSGIIQILS